MQIYCKNSRTSKKFPEGTSLEQMIDEFDFEKPYPIVSAKVNNVSQGLRYRAYHNKEVEFLDVTNASGLRVYRRSLYFLLYKASMEVFPGSKVFMEHPISNGYFCHLHKVDESPLTEEDIKLIEAQPITLPPSSASTVSWSP